MNLISPQILIPKRLDCKKRLVEILDWLAGDAPRHWGVGDLNYAFLIKTGKTLYDRGYPYFRLLKKLGLIRHSYEILEETVEIPKFEYEDFTFYKGKWEIYSNRPLRSSLRQRRWRKMKKLRDYGVGGYARKTFHQCWKFRQGISKAYVAGFRDCLKEWIKIDERIKYGEKKELLIPYKIDALKILSKLMSLLARQHYYGLKNFRISETKIRYPRWNYRYLKYFLNLGILEKREKCRFWIVKKRGYIKGFNRCLKLLITWKEEMSKLPRKEVIK